MRSLVKCRISIDSVGIAMYMQYLKGSEKDREEPKKGNKDSEKELYLQRFRELVHSLRVRFPLHVLIE